MINKKLEEAPQFYARLVGVVYLIIIVAGSFGELAVRNKMIVPGNAMATTNNIAASPLLWRLGIAGDLIMHVCDVITMTIFYLLLIPVNKNLALMSLLFNLIQTAVLVANKMTLMGPLFLLGNEDYLKALDPRQLQALTYLSARAHEYGFDIGLVFFGVDCLLSGYLIFKSGFLPKVLGIMMQIGGLGYLVNSFAVIVDPKFAESLSPGILVPSGIAEISLCLWLIVKGVNAQVWKEKAKGMQAALL